MSIDKNSIIPFMKKDEIETIVKSLAKKIEQEYFGKELILICPLKGSIHFLTDLCKLIKLNLKIDFVHLASTEKAGSIKIIKDISENITGKHVLIVEEIIDTGKTLNFLKNRLLVSNPASLKIVTLLDKPSRREISLKPDYVGKTIDDRYVIGYGMDSEDLGRNYSEILFFKN
jgi:hypoxanthine phosphoribosyltransferase